jgi:hypothetical protein
MEKTLMSKVAAFGDENNLKLKKLEYPDIYKDLGEIVDLNIINDLKNQVTEWN